MWNLPACPCWVDSVEKLSFPFRRATLIHQLPSRGPQRFKMTSGSDQTLRYRSTSPTFSTESTQSRQLSKAAIGWYRAEGERHPIVRALWSAEFQPMRQS